MGSSAIYTMAKATWLLIISNTLQSVNQGGEISGVIANSEIIVTLPISFNSGYQAFGISEGLTSFTLSKDTFSSFRLGKTANVGYYINWLAVRF